MKAKTKKKIRGSITVLLVIILIPMMTFSAVIVDMSRVNMAKAMISSAGDLAMNTSLANYDTILKDVYGLFAMSQEKTEAQMAEDIREYFKKTLVGYGVVDEENADDYVSVLLKEFMVQTSGTAELQTTDMLKMIVSDENTAIQRIPASALSKPDIMRKQIVEYMKYRAPLSFGMSFFDAIKSFQTIDDQTKVVEKQVEAQESAQDVTSACKQLIKLIREYDELVKSIDGGDKSLKGYDHSQDGKNVPLMDYDAQIFKYRELWGENYGHINRLNLVFLVNSPSVSQVYLAGLGGTGFIKPDNSGIVYNNCGFSLSPQLNTPADAAKAQLEAQINSMAEGSAWKNTANSYLNAGFIDPAHINESRTAFNNEQAAIDSFIAFEKFLLDQSELKYSDVKAVLEQIYILSKYYDNFYNEFETVIAAETQALNAAKQAVSNAQSEANQYSNWTNNMGININSELKEFGLDSKNTELVQSILSVDQNLYNNVKKALTEVSSAPTVNDSGYTFYNYNGYYEDNYLLSSGDSEDKYLAVMRDLAACESLKNMDEDYRKICDQVSEYLADSSEKTLASFVSDNLESNALYKLFELLDYCSTRRIKAKANIEAYGRIKAGYSALVSAQNEAQARYDAKIQERNETTQKYQTCLSWYRSFTDAYQADVNCYDSYIATAKNVMTREISAIQSQSAAIKSNLGLIVEKLDAIDVQMGNTEDAIKAYDQKVEDWETANTNYASSNSSDTFSDQNESDIAASKDQYSFETFSELRTQVGNIRTGYQTVLDWMTDGTHMKYGSAKVYELTDADGAKAAVAGSFATSEVVTLSAADAAFAWLYNSESPPVLYFGEMVEQICFLDPQTLPITFLQYLNETYPKEEEGADQTVKDQYEEAKEVLTGADGKDGSADGEDIKDETDVDRYGYTYKNAKLKSKSGLPSVSYKPEQNKDNNEFKLSQSTDENGNEKLNASDSMKNQSSILSKELSNVGNVLNTGLENIYILSYLFENFSYNTMVQDAVIEGAEKDVTKLSEAEMLMSSDASKYVGKIASLSNYPICGQNNWMNGAEVEYVLYGHLDPTRNVTTAKASIYAIRFGFNCIFAFTDSEIRASTMAAGLSVQAATLGVVPYQIVQVVLQLALAAAESAVDLSMMNCGMKVPIVKNKDTWSLNMAGMAEEATALAVAGATRAAGEAVDKATQSVQDFIDAGADELQSSVSGLCDGLEAATQKAAEDVVNAAFGYVMDELELIINDIQNTFEYGLGTARGDIMTRIVSLKDGLHDELSRRFQGNKVADAILSVIEAKLEGLIDNVHKRVGEFYTDIQDDLGVEDYEGIKEQAIGLITQIKTEMANEALTAVKDVTNGIESKVNDLTQELCNDLKNQVANIGDQAAEEVKAAIQEKANGYLSEYLGSGGIGSGLSSGKVSTEKTSSSVAAMMKFGYKDYLMLFAFIKICVDDEAILARMADLIQLNIQHATLDGGSSFEHSKKSEFKMSEARTYVMISAEVELEMLFMNLDLFADMVTENGETETENKIANTKIIYTGFLGY